ncbi:hypothetical protein H1C71_000277 [Ictidomys tridecemlineatus]|nr:hypothetical protein H1C71_000277 [Ictidomys tridecemlineatus]
MSAWLTRMGRHGEMAIPLPGLICPDLDDRLLTQPGFLHLGSAFGGPASEKGHSRQDLPQLPRWPGAFHPAGRCWCPRAGLQPVADLHTRGPQICFRPHSQGLFPCIL